MTKSKRQSGFRIRSPEAHFDGIREAGVGDIEETQQHDGEEECTWEPTRVRERQRIAQKIRSVGLGEQAKIQGKIAKDLQEIESEAYRKVQSVKGTAEAKAIRIYAQAMNADPDFYSFVRTLEAYKKSLPADTNLLLSTDNKFLELLRKK